MYVLVIQAMYYDIDFTIDAIKLIYLYILYTFG